MSDFAGSRRLHVAGVFTLCLLTSLAWADDKADVMAFVNRYAALEGDLAAQEALIREDRVMITNVRLTNQAQNMAGQKAGRKANEAMNGGPATWLVLVESPEVRVYGNTAVASFMRLTSVYPKTGAPINQAPLWVSLVLVKEGGKWGIAHTHLSPVGGN